MVVAGIFRPGRLRRCRAPVLLHPRSRIRECFWAGHYGRLSEAFLARITVGGSLAIVVVGLKALSFVAEGYSWQSSYIDWVWLRLNGRKVCVFHDRIRRKKQKIRWDFINEPHLVGGRTAFAFWVHYLLVTPLFLRWCGEIRLALWCNIHLT